MSSRRVVRYATWVVAAGVFVSLRSRVARLRREQAELERAVVACSRRIGAIEGGRLSGNRQPGGSAAGETQSPFRPVTPQSAGSRARTRRPRCP
ncbi:MAG: hypothetical protein ACYCXY_11610 [Acidimicrobiales bacterium]